MHKAQIAIGLVFLILSLPINSSIVIAQFVSSSTEGQHGINNILSRTDYLEIKATLDQPVDKERIKTSYPTPSSFDECHDEAGSHVCTFKTAVRDWSGGKYTYLLTIDDGAVVISSLPGVFYVDDYPPVVQEFDVVRDRDQINFSFKAKDTACDSCPGICAGLSIFSLIDENVKIWDTTLDSCVDSYQASIPVDKLAVMDGTAELCARVSDRIDQKSTKLCRNIEIDTVAPEIYPESFRIVDTKGNDITHISDRPVSAGAQVDVKESNLRLVRGDYSHFNSVSPGAYTHMEATCTQSDNIYTCKWDLVLDKIDGSLTATLYTEDKDNNSVTFTKGFTITKDTNKPQVISLHQIGIFSDNKRLALKEGENQLILEIADNGAEFNKSNVYLDMDRFGAGSVRARLCKFQTGWKCEFTATVSKPHGFGTAIFVHATSDVGNMMNETVKYDAVVDSRAPIVGEVNVTPDCGYAGQDLLLKVTASDDLNMTMTIDASAISMQTSNIKGTCEAGVCSATIGNLVSDHTKDNIIINITDLAGNAVTKHKMVEICEEDSVTIPNLVSVRASEPAELDKRLLSFLGGTSYVPMVIKTAKNSRIVSRQVSCSDTKSVHLLNSESTHPTLVIKLNKASISENKINVSCQMDFIVRKGFKVYSQPEIEQFSVTIPLFNNALGEITDSMKSKIDSVSNDIDDLQDDIEKWDEYNRWLNLLCSTAETLARINSVLQNVKEAVWGILTVFHGACNGPQKAPCENAVTRLWGKVCEGIGWYNNIIERFVWPTGFDLSADKAIGNIVKYGCMLYSCRICDWSTYINVGASVIATAVDRKKVVKIEGPTTQVTDEFELWLGNSEYFAPDEPLPQIKYNGDQATLTQTIYVDFWGAWKEQTKKNYMSFEPESSTWVFDPYRSIHYAKACLCMPAYVYNLRKERQIKCMYKTCLQQNSKVGLPTDSCEYAYKERQCLYVDGAQYKEHGFMGGFLDNLWDTLVANLPGILLGIAYAAACTKYRTDSTYKCEAPSSVGPMWTSNEVLCSLMGVASAIADIIDFTDGGIDFSKYDTDLGGKDYCSGG